MLRVKALETYDIKPIETAVQPIEYWDERIQLIAKRAVDGASARFADDLEPTDVEVVSPGYVGQGGIVHVDIKLTYDDDITVTAVRQLHCATSENPATWDYFYNGEGFTNLAQLGELLHKEVDSE